MAKAQVAKANLKVESSAELLSYIINQTPILRENLDLPVQGESIKPIGKLIMENPAYKNAFLNTINIIGLTVITRNHWENPWKKFTDKGTLTYGQQIREIICDIANVYDYNQFVNTPENMLKTVVPNVLSYLHEINYQKFYKTSTSDQQMAMAFNSEDLFSLIDEVVNSLYEGMEYDYYQVSKYMLARRILDGTVTAVQIENLNTKSDRDIVSEIKSYSNDMTFRSAKFNPAGIRKATSFDDQFAIVSTKFDAKFTTNVLATSYFKSDAEMKANMELCDGFGNFDIPRLAEVFAKYDEDGNIIQGEFVDGYVPFTDEEISKLNTIPCVIVGRDFFQMYKYGLDAMAQGRKTEFFNPQTMRTNHWLHTWGAVSSSPFENAICFTKEPQSIVSVSITPEEVSISAGNTLQFSSNVKTTGFANKSVVYSISQDPETDNNKKAVINQEGLLTIPKGHVATTENDTSTLIEVTATSIYDNTKSGTASITVL